MLIKKLLEQLPLSPAAIPPKKVEYTAGAAVHELPRCGEVLAVDVYSSKGELLYRFFSDGHSYITQAVQAFRDFNPGWTERNPAGGGTWGSPDDIAASAESLAAVDKVLKNVRNWGSDLNKAGSRAYGMDLVVVDTGKYKDMIASRMRKKLDEKGRWTVYAGCDMEYAEQVTAEHKVNVRKGGRTVPQWVQKHSHGANHYLDCEVYALAAADILNVRFLHLDEEAAGEPVSEPAPAPGEEWIKSHENWI